MNFLINHVLNVNNSSTTVKHIESENAVIRRCNRTLNLQGN
ncbi:protein of unknown function [Shewanella benthica]|uniref:Transposase n=1 Tax=Shewanella benthica TaxID=43661 RepID=A0A330M6U2_9GAMM|nr:protein of unknown function [Shewanella benthica]